MIEGLGYSGRIIGAAAAVMFCVFASFVLNGDPTIKQFGLGLATAVAIDAVVVCLFVPALITVAGTATLWLPRWLDWLLPHISIEGSGYFDDEPAPSAAPTQEENRRRECDPPPITASAGQCQCLTLSSPVSYGRTVHDPREVIST